jgi:putative phosphoribosyl transferase
MTRFEDRFDAGRFLARQLQHHAGNSNVVVLALPRGGVPVAFEIAREIDAPLDVFVVRKLGAPGYEELAMGAIATGGVRVFNEEVIQHLGVSQSWINATIREQEEELQRREQAYRGDRPPAELQNRTVILVDDGLATGASMRAAVRALRLRNPSGIAVAVPIGSRDTCDQFRSQVEEVVCGRTPEPFHAVGAWYRDFTQTTDDEVRELLDRAAHERRVRRVREHNHAGDFVGLP